METHGVLTPLAGIPVALALALASVPWFLYGLGAAMVGDDTRYDRAFERCPLGRYLDWIEERS